MDTVLHRHEAQSTPHQLTVPPSGGPSSSQGQRSDVSIAMGGENVVLPRSMLLVYANTLRDSWRQGTTPEPVALERLSLIDLVGNIALDLPSGRNPQREANSFPGTLPQPVSAQSLATSVTSVNSQVSNLAVQIAEFDERIQGLGIADVPVKPETIIW